MTVIAIAVCLPISADTPASVAENDMMPPVTAAADSANEYGVRIGADISVYDDDDEYYLFLPSSADISAVKLRYNGSLKNDMTPMTEHCTKAAISCCTTARRGRYPCMNTTVRRICTTAIT